MMSWAYEFFCDRSLEDLFAAISDQWPWLRGDSDWYGDYLKCRPMDGVRIRIHRPKSFLLPYRGGDQPGFYLAQVDLDSENTADHGAIDRTLRQQLESAGARNVVAIESYI